MLRRTLLQYSPAPPSPPSPENDFSAGFFETVVVLAVAVILSASFYLVLRFLSRRSDSSSSLHRSPNTIRQVSPVENKKKMNHHESLPLFTFDSLSARDGGDCAVCLSKFEPDDLLRLLPICCHAFHAECIDTWLAGNQSCPLCRSPIFISNVDLVGKCSLLRQNSLSSSASGSFRVEIGNVSRRTPPENSADTRRSYSIGESFNYILDNDVSEVPAGSFRFPAEVKVEPMPMEENEALAAEVGPRGGWLKECLSYSTSSSVSSSFRSSGRWCFTGSGRRSTSDMHQNGEPELDMGASQLSNEIGELFRWVSGV